jgi:hypothetical protein
VDCLAVFFVYDMDTGWMGHRRNDEENEKHLLLEIRGAYFVRYHVLAQQRPDFTWRGPKPGELTFETGTNVRYDTLS